jgi:hypothetical protein
MENITSDQIGKYLMICKVKSSHQTPEANKWI